MIYGWEDNGVRLPIIGQIKLGEKGEKMPRALDYFLCPPEVQKVYGEKPKALDVIIPHPDIDVVLQGYLRNQVPTTGQLVCRGNNREGHLRLEEAATKAEAFGLTKKGTEYINPATGELCEIVSWGGTQWLKIPCSTVGCPEFISGRCKPFYMFHFELPKVPGGAVGVYTIITRSTVNYQNLKTFLQHVELRCGSIHRVPLRLRLTTRTAHPYITKNGKRERIKTQVQALVLDAGDMTSEELDQALRRNRFFVPVPPQQTSGPAKPQQTSGPAKSLALADSEPKAPPAQESKQTPQTPTPPDSESKPGLPSNALSFVTVASATKEEFNGRPYAMVAAIPDPETAKQADLVADVWFICTMAGVHPDMDLLLAQPVGTTVQVTPARIDSEQKKIAAAQVYIKSDEAAA